MASYALILVTNSYCRTLKWFQIPNPFIFYSLSEKRVSLEPYQSWIARLFLQHTAVTRKVHTPSREERRFLYFNHLSKEFLEQMIPHLKALI